MQHYPGQGNPVLRALAGDLSIRQLRLMIEHLPRENVAVHAVHDLVSFRDLLHDVSDQLRILRAEVFNIVRDPNKPPIEEPELLPRPDQGRPDPQTQIQANEAAKAAQDHLLAVLNRPNPH